MVRPPVGPFRLAAVQRSAVPIDAGALGAGSTARVLRFAVKAASTLGTFLRSFRWGHVRQLGAVSRHLLARAWAAEAGPMYDEPIVSHWHGATLDRAPSVSTRNDRLYDVSSAKLDALVDIARGTPGVIASRMTGAGFGGLYCESRVVGRGRPCARSHRGRVPGSVGLPSARVDGPGGDGCERGGAMKPGRRAPTDANWSWCVRESEDRNA